MMWGQELRLLSLFLSLRIASSLCALSLRGADSRAHKIFSKAIDNVQGQA